MMSEAQYIATWHVPENGTQSNGYIILNFISKKVHRIAQG
jgi:hypothetical protein